MNFGSIISLIINLLGNTGAISDIVKLIIQLVGKIVPLLPTAAAPAEEMNVEWAQRSLAKLGFDPGTIDGVMGAKTGKAIAAYQAARGLIVDGWLGAETQTRLRMDSAS